jgi:hypothetical protein
MIIILKLKLHDYKIPTIVTNTIRPRLSHGVKTNECPKCTSQRTCGVPDIRFGGHTIKNCIKVWFDIYNQIQLFTNPTE